MTIYLCGLPERCAEARTDRPYVLLDLAPDGVYQAAGVTPSAGALLPHRFTLTCDWRTSPSAVCFLLHFPAGHPDWLLASILSSGAPTFLSMTQLPCRGHPAYSPRLRRLALDKVSHGLNAEAASQTGDVA